MAFNQPPYTDWKLLGKLELPAGSPIEEKIDVWLMEILHPLNLQEDFFNRLLKSVHAVHVEKMTDFESVSFFIYSPWELAQGQTWGFFRIDKIGNSMGNKSSSHHSIEFYLYLESS
jgi:hypothetical protein